MKLVSALQDCAAPSGPWLHDCIVSLSPCSDLLVVAREQKAVFLSGQTLHTVCLTLSSSFYLKGVSVFVFAAKWRTDESGREEMTLGLSWSGTLSTEEGSDCLCS